MDENNKTCRKCLISMPCSYFCKDSSKAIGISLICRICKNEQTKQRRLIIKNLVKETPNEKTCNSCNKIKLSDKFSKLKINKDGLSHFCKECISKKRKNKKKEIKSEILVDNNIIKKCIKCNIEKVISNFKINRKSLDNFSNICINCTPKSSWNKEKQKLSEQKYRMNNPEKMKEKYKRQSNNINRRIRDCLNHRISDALKKDRFKKNNKTNEYIGCDIDFLKAWIEYQFRDNMNWNNYGEWHLDHVKPCSSYDLSKTEHIKECFSWKNLQPLWAKENIIKSNKIDDEFIKIHREKANNYEIMIISK